MATKIKARTKWECRTRKPEFFRHQEDKEHKTDQSQLAQASIVEMAQKFGIDAIIAKAKQREVDMNVQNQLYGHDLTESFKSMEDLLNTKKRVANVFMNIPAVLRKELFNDDIVEFVNTYTTQDERKLEALNKVGIISDTQLKQVKNYNIEMAELKAEQAKQQEFMKQLEKQKEGLYEQFKKSGNIDFGNEKNAATDSKGVE